MKRCIVGIDSDMGGAIVVIDKMINIVAYELTPSIKDGSKRHADIAGMIEICRSLSQRYRCHALIEDTFPLPKQSGASVRKQGIMLGAWQAIAICHIGSYELIRPRVWQSCMHAGCAGADTKTRSIIACGRLFPDLNLIVGNKRTPHRGLADAALISLYGARKYFLKK